jgi:hypothetical protein
MTILTSRADATGFSFVDRAGMVVSVRAVRELRSFPTSTDAGKFEKRG